MQPTVYLRKSLTGETSGFKGFSFKLDNDGCIEPFGVVEQLQQNSANFQVEHLKE